MRFDLWTTERERAEMQPNGLKVLRDVNARGYFVAMLWYPKALKPALYQHYKTEEAREKALASASAAFDLHQERKVERRRAQSIGDATLADPGAIFSYSWGYDQTQCEFFQTVKRSGLTVYIRPIACESEPGSGGFMCDRVRPRKDAFIDDCQHCRCYQSAALHDRECGSFDHEYEPKPPIKKRLTFCDGSPYLSFDHGCGSLVKVYTFGNAEPLVVSSLHRSWYH